MSRKKSRKIFRKIYYLLLILISIITIYLSFNITFIPTKYIYLLIAFFIINLLLILALLFRKKKILRIIAIFISLILIIISAGISYVYIRSNSFFNKITNVEYETSNYIVIALKDNNISKLEEIKNIGIYSNDLDKNYSLAIEDLNKKIQIKNIKYTGIFEQVTNLLENKVDSILINENYLDIIEETTNGFKDKIKIIDTLSIEVLKEKKAEEEEIKKIGNFNIYISGIDTYGPINKVSRSDVNIIASVNINKGKILLTNTPRDYFVQLSGTTGLKDKLTHAGYYGVETSMGTLEKLYDTKIDYYIRVNFNSLINIVDKIGGVDVYSDRDLWTSSGTYVKYGWNHFNGKQALAYARERKMYESGDRHRGQNQQQVIEAIFKKVTKSNDINNYLNLLDAIQNSIQTNISEKMINKLINLQVKNNYDWTFESIGVDGEGSSDYTYSYPDQKLYVMLPYYDTVETAKDKIKEQLDNK